MSAPDFILLSYRYIIHPFILEDSWDSKSHLYDFLHATCKYHNLLTLEEKQQKSNR